MVSSTNSAHKLKRKISKQEPIQSNRGSKSVRRGGGVVTSPVPAGGGRAQLQRAGAGGGRLASVPRGARAGAVPADGRARGRRAACRRPHAPRPCHTTT